MRLLKILPFCSLLTMVLGCGPMFKDYKEIDFSEHFWTYVNGSYHSSKNGYYVTLNRSTREATWYKPLKVGNRKVCYLAASGKLEKVSNYEPELFSGNNPAQLMAKVKDVVWYTQYATSATPDEQVACEAAAAENTSYVPDWILVPVISYGPGVVRLGEPEFCFFSCNGFF